MDRVANLNQVEIKVDPNQFHSAANPVNRVPAKGVVSRLNSKKESNKMNNKTIKDNAYFILIKQGKEP